MKTTDDYKAKLAAWARNPQVLPLPRVANLPRFGYRRFDSYDELNRWKRELLLALARNGGAQWTR